MFLFVVGFALATLIPIFEKKVYEMEETAHTFKYYDTFDSGDMRSYVLNGNGEMEITLRQLL